MSYVNFIKPAFYNEFDEHAADWLENLIRLGVIAPGDVDRRSIVDICPDDLRGYRQCHFFAGIGVWSYAFRRLGVPDDTPVWSGSTPCQPFSAAGKGLGVDDERHLWPAQFHLIQERRPAVFYGEQVASKDGLAWLDLVRSDLEGADYAAGFLDTCSAGTGAPHIRQRLRICAYDQRSSAIWLEHATGFGRQQWWTEPGEWRPECGRGFDGLGDLLGEGLEGHGGNGDGAGGRPFEIGPASKAGELDGMADADGRDTSAERQQRSGQQRLQPKDGEFAGRIERPCPTNGFWRNADWLFCRDEQWRPVSASTLKMANGSSRSVGPCRAPVEDTEACRTRLSALLDTFDQKTISEWAGGYWSLQEEEVLRPYLHGELDGRTDQEFDSREQPPTICESCRDVLRSLPEDERFAPCTSCGRKSAEQRSDEFEDVVRFLPREIALAELHGRRESAEVLYLLLRTINEEGALLHPLRQGETAWSSLGEDAKDRIRLAFNARAWRRVVSFPLVDGGVFRQGSGHPVYEGKSRQGMLKGYGNAIDAEATVEFIAATFGAHLGSGSLVLDL